MGRVARVLCDGRAERRWRQARVSCLGPCLGCEGEGILGFEVLGHSGSCLGLGLAKRAGSDFG